MTSDVHVVRNIKYHTTITKVCEFEDIPRPLTFKVYNEMSDLTKLSIVDVNYPTFGQNYRYKVVNEFRLFAFLVDNCTKDNLLRQKIAERVMDDVDHRESK